ncbi:MULTISPECIES: transcriptional repressor LexA [unclassified Ruminococcus]|uniref:transcriptional repressor LexA n=1 Tax=unclassified Ruminococcus TaxID=2608920 RepID=UPI00210A0EAF|nr:MULTISPECIES: transcriptional repressor LexA [unclassified Ruminococcus]MCQ4023091.1 transcriptional repressor LexA [Ruminococcus sp. zg-924]MCQ4115528.1 transcriptional repressor LexA [Ruminococcus sp. zg-921]
MKPLSQSQQKILKYITECTQNGHSPSVRDICAATGLRSTSTVHSHLKTLKNLGFIDKEEKLNRTIRLTNSDPSSSVPIMGKVTAGLPIEAIEDIEGYVPVSEGVRRGRELFALRIVGDSMINAGILDGDIVVVNREQTAENGEIVVALIDDEATVKRFYKENGHFRLQPENPNYEPIIVPECSVLGKVIEVIRYY